MARTGHFCCSSKNDRIRRSGPAQSLVRFARMTTHTSLHPDIQTRVTTQRANDLANSLELGARALIAFATGLTEEQWQARTPHDGRPVGVIVHHVASVYPIEIQLAQTVAQGKPVTGVRMED